MNIFHFNTYLNGGAAAAARRLHEELVRAGSASRFCHRPGIASPDATYMPLFQQRAGLSDVWHKLRYKVPCRPFDQYYLKNRPQGYDLFSSPRAPFDCSVDIGQLGADIINLNWIAEWIDYPGFFASIPDNFPVVWTLHDMNPFTGGCHYAWECEKFKTGCHSCFQLNENRGPHDLSFRAAAVKRAAVAKKNLHVVADSTWLEAQARASSIFEHARSFQTIHYGLDTGVFRPKDKRLCRKLLDIPEFAFVLCFGAADLGNKRKGLALLEEALARVSYDAPVFCLLFGAQQGAPLAGCSQKSVGQLASVDLQTIVYSAADLFVIPSLHEAFGLTALEAMACGVPVVGFATGGIPDMIRHEHNGLLAAPSDAADLADKITLMIRDPLMRAALAANARKTVEEHFTIGLQAENYLRLFNRIRESQ
jgi:glycosyltransferase involved in cell wall biosynthesis